MNGRSDPREENYGYSANSHAVLLLTSGLCRKSSFITKQLVMSNMPFQSRKLKVRIEYTVFTSPHGDKTTITMW